MVSLRTLVLLLAVTLVIAACGGDGDPSGEAIGTVATTTAPTSGVAPPSTTAPTAAGEATSTTAATPAVPAPSAGGNATLTVGDRTWEFQSSLCAFGEEAAGQEGVEFTLSAIQDGLQLYATIDSWGHSISINDIEDFENPSVSLEASSSLSTGESGSPEFIEISGKSVTATATFVDMAGDGFTGSLGTLVAACP